MRPAVFVLLLLPSSWALYAQKSPPNFSVLDNNPEKLENLIADTLNTSETPTVQLEDLNLTPNERAVNRRARELVEGAGRNVGNPQDTLLLIKEIRSRLRVPEDFYGNRDTDGGPY
jgi:hypothetical protein